MDADWYVRAQGAVGGRRCVRQSLVGVCAGRQHTLYFLIRDRSRRTKRQGGEKRGYCANTSDKDADKPRVQHPNPSRKSARITCSPGSFPVPTFPPYCTLALHNQSISQRPTQWPNYLTGYDMTDYNNYSNNYIYAESNYATPRFHGVALLMEGRRTDWIWALYMGGKPRD